MNRLTTSIAPVVAAFAAFAVGAPGRPNAPPDSGKHGLTIEDMLAMQRISEPDVSPDGKLVAFTVRDTDFDANRGRTDVWLAAVDGSFSRRLTTHPENDSSPIFSADGKSVYFASTRSG